MNQAQTHSPSPDNLEKLKALAEKANALYTEQRMEEAKIHLEEMLSIAPHNVSAIEMLGIIEHSLGNREKAIEVLNKGLSVPGPNARIYNTLGHIKYFLQGDLDAAEDYYLKALAINPGLAPAHKNLGGLYLRQGNWPKSVQSFANAVINDPKNLFFMQLFAQSLGNFTVSGFNPGIKKVITMCLEEDKISHRYLAANWILTIDYDPDFGPLKSIPFKEPFSGFLKNHNLDKLQPVLNDPFLLLGLRRDYVSALKYETIFTYIRRLFLSKLTGGKIDDLKDFLPFIQHLAIQCWLNEYVFNETDEEEALIQKLQDQVENQCKNTPDDILRLSMLACYRPLHRIRNASDLLDTFKDNKDKALHILLDTQIADPLEEEDIKKTIPVHGHIDNQISQEVQNQYEENPYPRWETIHTGEQHIFNKEKTDILVAGCGTGQQPASIVASYPNSKALCVDLSLSSLAYAVRQCRDLGINQLTFKQADILQLGSLGKQFETIYCNGVLHHMQEPEEGLKVLIGLLKPEGTMFLSLYSEVARPHVVAARAYIKEQGLKPTIKDIRRMRAIVPDHPDELIRHCAKGRDFFTLSQCRDMIFHVQEHRFTISQIRDMLDRHNLSFLGFYNFSEKELYQFKSRFPEEKAEYDLDKWELFEQEQPEFFLNKMYNFKVCHSKDFKKLQETHQTSA